VLACGWLAELVVVVLVVVALVVVVFVGVDVAVVVSVTVELVGVVVSVEVGVVVSVAVGVVVALESPITCAEACSSSPVGSVKPHGGRLSPSREDDDSCGSGV
jgi:hypothetical protein